MSFVHFLFIINVIIPLMRSRCVPLDRVPSVYRKLTCAVVDSKPIETVFRKLEP